MNKSKRNLPERRLVRPPARVKKDQVELSKAQIALNVATLFLHPDFPEDMYVALEDCSLCARGCVVFSSFEVETPFEFIPYARIDQLVTNIPSKKEYLEFFSEEFGIGSLEEITKERNQEFWRNFEMKFADEVRDMKIIWE